MTGGTTNWRLGFTLSLTTAVLWGLLPIALKFVLEAMDAYTIAWWRFASRCPASAPSSPGAAQLPRPRRGPVALALLAVAMLTLIGNYVLYLFALDHTTPSVTQVVIQLAPLLLILGGVFVFRERFDRRQWIGFAVLVAGLLLFFNHRLPDSLLPTEGLGLGVALMVMAAVSWALYGLAQKRLLDHFTAPQVFLMLYVGATSCCCRLPRRRKSPTSTACSSACSRSAAPTRSRLTGLSARRCHWDVSRVSAVISTAPLFTIGCDVGWSSARASGWSRRRSERALGGRRADGRGRLDDLRAAVAEVDPSSA